MAPYRAPASGSAKTLPKTLTKLWAKDKMFNASCQSQEWLEAQNYAYDQSGGKSYVNETIMEVFEITGFSEILTIK